MGNKSKFYMMIAGVTFLELGYLISDWACGFSGHLKFEIDDGTIKTVNKFSIIISIWALLGFFGAFIGEPIAESMGRKKGLIIGDVIFIIGCILNMIDMFGIMVTGRALQGLSLGITMVISPIYLREHLRGKKRTSGAGLSMIFFGLGLCILALVGYSVRGEFTETKHLENWQVVFGVKFVFPIMRLILLSVAGEETPVYLFRKNKHNDASKVVKLNCKHQETTEKKVVQEAEQQQKCKGIGAAFNKPFGDHTKCSLLLSLGWTFSGVFLMFPFGYTIIQATLIDLSGSEMITTTVSYQNYYLAIAVMVFAFASIGMCIRKAAGSKILVVVGGILMVITLLVFVIVSYVHKWKTVDVVVGFTGNKLALTMIIIWGAGFGLYSVGAYCHMVQTLLPKAWGLTIALFMVPAFFMQQFTGWTSLKDKPDGFSLGFRRIAIVDMIGCLIFTICAAATMKDVKNKKDHEIWGIPGFSKKNANSQLNNSINNSQAPWLINNNQQSYNQTQSYNQSHNQGYNQQANQWNQVQVHDQWNNQNIQHNPNEGHDHGKPQFLNSYDWTPAPANQQGWQNTPSQWDNNNNVVNQWNNTPAQANTPNQWGSPNQYDGTPGQWNNTPNRF